MNQYEKEHLNIVIKNGAECTVLLKSNGKFPLTKTCKLAAFGAGLRHTVKGGTGSGEVNSRFSFTIEEGLEKEGFEITTKEWLNKYDKKRTDAKKYFIKKIKADARKSHQNPIVYSMGKEMVEPYYEIDLCGEGDAAIYVLARSSGEGSDRTVTEGDVKLTKSEIKDILELNRRFEKFMLVLNVGGVVDLSPVMEVGNILLLSQIGVDSGKILSDILLGKQNPSGKLSTTWAAFDNYSKEGTFGDMDETLYKEGIYVGYRYFDTFKKEILFPFGYGLSYTKFETEVESVKNESDKITVKIKVKNTGTFSGKEVLQVYLSLPDGKIDKAYQEFAGFTKTSNLLPGETESVDISFYLSDFASYDQLLEQFVLEKGDYIVRVGNSSRNTIIAACVNLDKSVVTKKTKNCLGNPIFSDIKSSQKKVEEIPSGAIRLFIKSNEIKTKLI
ncbi:MAG: glycoside hydrolase family 3 C-terminal domain-containing protein, partial [Treponema sp.]|nr:glycoside hydrolase family 3 C-terminal domain-containing protein [Treponema sp.]